MSRFLRWGRPCVLCLVPIFLASCDSGPRQPQNPKKTIPVRGEVTVDGKPGAGIQVILAPKAGQETGNATFSSGTVGEDGKFEVRTYGLNDGAPAGEYALTFQWIGGAGAGEILSGEDDESADRFGGKYADPAKSKHSVTVGEDDTEVVIPPIELSSQ